MSDRDPRCVLLDSRIMERTGNENLTVWSHIGEFVDSDSDSGKYIYVHVQEGWAQQIRCDWTHYEGVRNSPRLTEEERNADPVPLKKVFQAIEDYCVARFSGTLDMDDKIE